MSPSPSTDDATAEQEGGVRVLGIGEGETAGVFDALSSPTARPRALVGLSVLVLAVVIGGWVSGVGVGNADAPITANATVTLGDGEQYYPSNESVRIVVSRGGGGDPLRTEVVPLGELVRRECREAGARRVQALLEARYPEPHSYFATGTPGDYVGVTALYDPFARPNYYRLERSLPDRVRVIVTIAFGDRTETCTVPIRVEGALTAPSAV